jgi:ACS family hexuronate transporter-like MFS transporter
MNPDLRATFLPLTVKIRHLRWYLCGVICLAAVINLVDRQVLSILAPDLQRQIGWSELGYARIVIAFQISYATMMMVSGWISDRIGTKLSYSLAMVWWSVAEISHAFVHTPLGFGLARLFLGVGEAAYFPASMKTIAEWFPKRESALATGILNAAVTVGAIVSPIIIPLINAACGWRGTFIATGALVVLPLIGWLTLYRRPEVHPRLTAEERELICAGRESARAAKISWVRLLGYRQTWAIAAPKILTDPVFYFCLYWLPKFLAQDHNIRGTAIIPYLSTVWALTGIGSIIGGYISSRLIQRGWTVNWARKAAMAICAVVTPVVIVASKARSPWVAVLLIGAALAGHQGFSTNLFTLASDLFPSRAVASVVGIGGFLGSMSAVLTSELTGRVLERNPSFYLPMFIVAGSVYMVALIAVHLFTPRMEPAPVR